jgi:hypothetical protein
VYLCLHGFTENPTCENYPRKIPSSLWVSKCGQSSSQVFSWNKSEHRKDSKKMESKYKLGDILLRRDGIELEIVEIQFSSEHLDRDNIKGYRVDYKLHSLDYGDYTIPEKALTNYKLVSTTFTIVEEKNAQKSA